jgi:hypothetical protein
MKNELIFFSGIGLALSVVGCSSDTTGNPGADAGADATASGGKGGAGGSSGSGAKGGGKTDSGSGGATPDAGDVWVTGIVVDITDGDATKNFDGSKYPKLAGVKVCVYGDSSIPCAITDSSGKYALLLPSGLTGYLSYEKDGYAPMLYGVTATAGQNTEAPAMLMTTSDYRDAFGVKGGVAPDPSTGEILFGATTLTASSTPFHEFFGATELYYVEGFSVGIRPAAKAGPVYTSETWEADATLKQASAAGWGFFQAAPGDYTLTIAHPGMTCGTVTTKVVKGYSTTYVGTLCTPNATDAGTITDGGAGGPADAGKD